MGKRDTTLICSECLARNYSIFKSESRTQKVELKKYCKNCNKHTKHTETR